MNYFSVLMLVFYIFAFVFCMYKANEILKETEHDLDREDSVNSDL